jgi:hypothetical protein
MKSLPPLRLASALFAATGALGVAQAQPRPYVETTSLTFLWNFVHTGVSTVTQAPGALPGPNLDPRIYNPTEPISTDTSAAQIYRFGNGTHDFLMERIIQAYTRNRGFNLNEDYFIRDVDHNRDGEIADVDTDGNGVLENIDRNDDGIIANIDRNGDGIIFNNDLNDDGVISEDEIEVEAELEVESLREALLGKASAPRNWQLVAVREVPRTVQELATNPYTIYLTIIDRVAYGAPIVLTKIDEYGPEETPDLPEITEIINTGITFTLGQWAASGTVREKYTGPYVTDASGKVTTAFNFKLGALFYDDPRYLAANNAKPHQYHLKRHVWELFANGHIIYNLRRIQGPIGVNLDGAFYATNVDMTGTGWFSHEFLNCTAKEEPAGNYFIDEVLPSSYAYSGLAPLRVKMGNIQYQNRNMFPDFGVVVPPPPVP